MNPFLADAILVVHFAFVLFVVGGLPLIWAGALLGWQWVRNFRFRVAHLAAIGVVVAESLAGIWCPLTVWEARLRGAEADKSFVAQWIHRLMYYDLPEWVFTSAYVAFAVTVAATWYFVRPLKNSGAPRRP